MRVPTAFVLLLGLLASQVHALVPHHHHDALPHDHAHSSPHEHDGLAKHQHACGCHCVDQGGQDHGADSHDECLTRLRARAVSADDMPALLPTVGLTVEFPLPPVVPEEHRAVLLPHVNGPPGGSQSRAPPAYRYA